MKRILLKVAYDGTNYCGWQLQPNVVTIESELNKQLKNLFQEEIKVIGASRTDSGVHSNGNLAVFDTEARMPADKICYAINQRLPEDIRVIDSYEVPMDFHPRHISTKKTYLYKIENTRFPAPCNRLYAYNVYQKLDIDKMQHAATYLIGELDFKSFCSIHAEVESTIRTIFDIKVIQKKEIIEIFVVGNGFLYNMVRIIAGTLIQVGMGKIQPEEISKILEKRNRSFAGPTAPAKGLTLYSYEICE